MSDKTSDGDLQADLALALTTSSYEAMAERHADSAVWSDEMAHVLVTPEAVQDLPWFTPSSPAKPVEARKSQCGPHVDHGSSSAPAAGGAAAAGGGSSGLDHLLHASAGGDALAFERLYRLSSASLFALVRRIVWNRAEAEEVLQETYVKVWRFAVRFDAHQSQALTWMSRIARNQAIDHRRRNTGRCTNELALDNEWTEGDSIADLFAEPGQQPENVLQRRQAQSSMEALLNCLSAAQRQVLVLAFREGCSHAEIAEQLGAPLGTVKSWMRRGLQTLKDALEQQRALGGSARGKESFADH